MFSFYVNQQRINKINIMTNESELYMFLKKKKSELYMEPKTMYVPNIYDGY